MTTRQVSILIPCYNAERWIGEAIESALAQTWPAKEVIVVDDGSTDGSLAIIRSFGDRILWETGPNRGGNAARNRLLELAQGEWLQYLDADDYLLPGKVAGQMDFLESHPETDVVYGPVFFEYWSDQRIRRELEAIPLPHDPWILLPLWHLPQTGAVLWRKEALIDVGRWKEDQPCCQEHELYTRMLVAGKRFVYCEHSGAVYRQWGEHTVCKRDKPEVRRRRLEIEQRIEDVLRSRGELTLPRLTAINQARFEMARLTWQSDRAEALRIMGLISRSQPSFRPGGKAAPASYRILMRLVGFRLTETIAEWRRRLGQPAGAV